MGQSDPDWTCEPLTVEQVLETGEDLVYYAGRVLYWLEQDL